MLEKKPILFRDTPYSKFVKGGKKWFKTGDEKTHVKCEEEIVNGVQMAKELSLILME